ncbi:hypothetical protein ACJX0J_026714 [Zea mays]
MFYYILINIVEVYKCDHMIIYSHASSALDAKYDCIMMIYLMAQGLMLILSISLRFAFFLAVASGQTCLLDALVSRIQKYSRFNLIGIWQDARFLPFPVVFLMT